MDGRKYLGKWEDRKSEQRYLSQGHVATVSVFTPPDKHMALKWNLVPESGESYVCHHTINRSIPAVSAGSSGMPMDRRPVAQ